jgi:hypothetical protein
MESQVGRGGRDRAAAELGFGPGKEKGNNGREKGRVDGGGVFTPGRVRPGRSSPAWRSNPAHASSKLGKMSPGVKVSWYYKLGCYLYPVS